MVSSLFKAAGPGLSPILGPILGLGLVVIAVAVAGCAHGTMGQSADPAEEQGTARQPDILPLDAAALERTETATFALG